MLGGERFETDRAQAGAFPDGRGRLQEEDVIPPAHGPKQTGHDSLAIGALLGDHAQVSDLGYRPPNGPHRSSFSVVARTLGRFDPDRDGALGPFLARLRSLADGAVFGVQYRLICSQKLILGYESPRGPKGQGDSR